MHMYIIVGLSLIVQKIANAFKACFQTQLRKYAMFH